MDETVSLKKLLAKNTLFNLTGYVYLLVASFIAIPILLSSLGSSFFGIYLLLATVVPLSSLLDFGLSQAVVRKLSLPAITQEERRYVWQTGLWLYLTSSFFLFLTVFGFLLLIKTHLGIFFILDKSTYFFLSIVISLTSVLNHLSTPFLALFQAKQRFDIYNIKTFVVGSGNTIISALVASFLPQLIPIFLIQLVFHLISILLLIKFSQWSWALKFWPKFSLVEAKDLIAFGIRYFVGVASAQINAQFSKYALGAYLSAEAVTAFSIPQNIVIKAVGLVSQLSLAFFPLGISLLQPGKTAKLKIFVVSAELLILAGALVQLILVYLFGYQFLSWWLKDEAVVALAFPAFRILSFYFLLTTLTLIPTALLQSINYPHIPSLFSFFSTLIHSFLVIYLTPKYQVLGPAYALLIASVINVPIFLLVFVILFHRQVVAIEKKVRKL